MGQTRQDRERVVARRPALALRAAIELNVPINRPWGIRTACFADPAGHIWEIAK